VTPIVTGDKASHAYAFLSPPTKNAIYACIKSCDKNNHARQQQEKPEHLFTTNSPENLSPTRANTPRIW
jgi:hypothetical protein